MRLREHARRLRPALLAAAMASAVLAAGGCEPANEPLSRGFAVDADTYCGDWAKLRSAGFVYENNVWNQGTVKRQDRSQCLLRRVVDGETQYGWRWRWPLGSGEVKAYPEVIYGHKPWLASSTTASLPRRISTIDALSVAYEIEMRARGRYNLAFDIWVTEGGRPTPAAITHEIMIWVGEPARAWEPAPGHRADTVTIGDATYDLYVKPHAEWIAEHGAPNVAYIAFNARTPRLTGDVDVKAFLDYLTRRGYVPAGGYVASVEFGNEVMSGEGELWLKSYEVRID